MAKKPQNTAGNRNEDSAPQERKWPDKAIIRYIIRALVLLIVFAWALVNLDAVLRFLGKVLALFTPFLIGGAIAFLINIVLRPLECCWNKVCRRAPEKLTRPVCLSASTVLVLGILFAVVFMMIPSLRESRLDYQQAKVDFNADSAKYMKQQELLHTSRINLNELMANANVDQPLSIVDSIIRVNANLNFEELWDATLATNASLLKADQNTTIAQLDYKKINARNYPYLKLNTGYGYTLNKYDIAANSQRGNLGFNGGLTVGFNIFDGNRRREKRNASIAIKNARLQRQEVEQALRADISNLWQAYRNNLKMLNLERQNLVAAKENHEIAMERYMLGDLAGIEMREAQKSLLDAEERILSAEYDTKLCEISLLQISGKVLKYLN